jgi:hypothetical protein
MALPRPDEYNQAIQNPRFAFTDNDLKSCQVESTPLGLPKPYSGGFTTTYKLFNSANSWAARCFTREVHDLQKRYQVIGDFFSQTVSKYFVEAKFLRNGINVNGSQYPIIKMQWLDGELLNTYVNRIRNQKSIIEKLLIEFLNLFQELQNFGIAHGDLQHGNIIIKKEKLFLIDYDGMFFPELSFLKIDEIGHPNYQHPKRTVTHYNNNIDRFSAIVIYFGLKILSVEPSFWNKFDNSDNILFKRDDFLNPLQSQLIKQIILIPELKPLTENFIQCCFLDFEKIPKINDFISGNFPHTSSSRNSTKSNPQTKSSHNFSHTEAEVFNELYINTSINKQSSPALNNPVQKNKKSNDWGLITISILFILLIGYFLLFDQKKDTTASSNSSTTQPYIGDTTQMVMDTTSKMTDTTSVMMMDTTKMVDTTKKINDAALSIYGQGNGNISIYKICRNCGSLKVLIDGVVVGELIESFTESNTPDCSAYGTFSKIETVGHHTVSVSDDYGYTDSKDVYVTEGTCSNISFEKQNPYGEGNGSISIYHNCSICSNVRVSIDGEYARSLSRYYYDNYKPDCNINNESAISKPIATGRHEITAIDDNNNTWSGYVYISEGKCTPYALQNFKRANLFGEGNGQISLWTSMPVRYQVYIDDGYYSSGSLQNYFQSGVPICAQDGTLPLTLTAGWHTFKAAAQDGSGWTGKFYVTEGGCTNFKINN